MRLPPHNSINAGDPAHNYLYFDDGGMRGLACAVVWCSLLYHGLTLKEEELTSTPMVELCRSLLAIPTFHRSGPVDEAAGMIRRIIKQNVDAKKQAVSSYEWSMILSGLSSKGASAKAPTMQEAIDMYNSNPEVAAHGGSSGKDRLPKKD